MTVYPSMKTLWKPITYDRLWDITVHGTVTANEYDLSLSDPLVELEGVQKIPFNQASGDAVVMLPKPAGLAGKQLKLLITKTSSANAAIILKSTWTDTNSVVHNYLIDTSTTSGQAVQTIALAGTTTATLSVMVSVFCDGNFWFVTH